MQILAIDGSPTQIQGSQFFGQKTASTSPITYLVQRIEGAGSASDEITSWLGPRNDGRGMIIGLHACGKLTDDTIGMFLKTEALKALVVVGCESQYRGGRRRMRRRLTACIPPSGCYNHLGTGPGPECFPTSAVMKELGVSLSSTARMAACQSVSRWADEGESRPKDLERRTELRRATRERSVQFSSHLIHG
jgi:hypothetical protein